MLLALGVLSFHSYKKKHSECIDCFRKAIALSNNDATIINKLGAVYADLGQHE